MLMDVIARALLAIVLAGLAWGPALAEAKLVLRDGTVLTGKSVQRKDGLYLLEGEKGSIVPVPAELVAQLQLLDGMRAPSGIEVAKPKTVAGPAWAGTTPPFREQIAAFGAAGYVPPLPPVDPVWRPASDWTEEGKAALLPVRWSVAPMDTSWTPKSAYTKAGDVTGFHPVRWFAPRINPVWTPVDSWGETVWFRPLVAPTE
jgi:hypothetical protein